MENNNVPEPELRPKPTLNKLILFGAGGHAKSCIDIILQQKKYRIISIIEKTNSKEKFLYNYKIINDQNFKNLKKMVKSIREVETILGNGIKKPSKTELENLKVVRKYIVANEEIKKGNKFKIANLNFKRTGKKGISPMNIEKVINKKAGKNFKKDDLITI